MVLALFVQQLDGNNIILLTKSQLGMDRAVHISHAFSRDIAAARAISRNFGRIACIVVLKHFRIHYELVNEVFLACVTRVDHNPFDGRQMLDCARLTLTTVCKGMEVTVSKIQKMYLEVYFAMERILYGDNGLDVLSQKLMDIAPHAAITGILNHGTAQVHLTDWDKTRVQLENQAKRFASLQEVEFTIPGLTPSEDEQRRDNPSTPPGQTSPVATKTDNKPGGFDGKATASFGPSFSNVPALSMHQQHRRNASNVVFTPSIEQTSSAFDPFDIDRGNGDSTTSATSSSPKSAPLTRTASLASIPSSSSRTSDELSSGISADEFNPFGISTPRAAAAMHLPEKPRGIAMATRATPPPISAITRMSSDAPSNASGEFDPFGISGGVPGLGNKATSPTSSSSSPSPSVPNLRMQNSDGAVQRPRVGTPPASGASRLMSASSSPNLHSTSSLAPPSSNSPQRAITPPISPRAHLASFKLSPPPPSSSGSRRRRGTITKPA
eukprot:TRINITY_DN5425_c0_g1_i1.p1 TRINITY_DN5425_c0_g1~~TRINITY_DN5425_c0_g1_i1.p1  ORF type:complete len:497 (+),score=149.08 TRINITY_DN5425_c0_g1_i1:265-1755(+)